MNEMGETCKLCLKYIQGDTVAALDEDLLAKLDFIQMDLERSVEESNSICTECKEKIQNAFDFKFCVVQTENAELGASGSQAQNICDIPSTSSGESSTEKTICRLCKNSVAVISVIRMEKLLKDDNVMELFQGHIPEFEFQESENSMVCEPCQKALASFSILVSSWSIANDWNEDDNMKEDMNNFGAVEVKKEDEDEFSDSNTNSLCGVDASDSGKIVKKAKGNRGQITKVKTETDEQSDLSESVSVNSKDVKKEESGEEDEEAYLQLKDEEVDIKDEEGNSQRMPNLIPTKRDSLIRKIETKQRSSNLLQTYRSKDCSVLKIGNNLQKYERQEYPFASKHNLRNRNIIHKNMCEVETYKCQECSFTTKDKRYFGKHSIIHKSIDEVETYRCQECSYVTKHKHNLSRHSIIHKSMDETKIYKCQICCFTTKHKDSLSKHSVIHKSIDEIETYECQECSYTTRNKNNMRNHLIIHKNIDKVETYKCQECSYTTKRKHYLRIHNIIHKSTDEVKIYKCQECSFTTKHKTNLGKHNVVHKSIDELKTYSCEECSFRTKHKNNLRKHSLIHKSMNEIKTYKCEICSFTTKYKYKLKNHGVVHKSIDEVETYKCQKCSYITKRKYNLVSHSKIHQNADKKETYECPECSYATMYKSNLKTHSKIHQSEVEVEAFKCPECSFTTKHKQTLDKHLVDHKTVN